VVSVTLPAVPLNSTLVIDFDFEIISEGGVSYFGNVEITLEKQNYGGPSTVVSTLKTSAFFSGGIYVFKAAGNYFNNYDDTYSRVSYIKFKLKAHNYGIPPTLAMKAKNINIYIDTAFVSITKDQALLYAGQTNYLEWTPEKLIGKFLELTTTNLIVADAVFKGQVVFQGDVVVSGELSSHPTVVPSADITSLTGAVVIDSLDFDLLGHVIGHSTRSLTPADISAVASSDTTVVRTNTAQTISAVKTFSTGQLFSGAASFRGFSVRSTDNSNNWSWFALGGSADTGIGTNVWHFAANGAAFDLGLAHALHIRGNSGSQTTMAFNQDHSVRFRSSDVFVGATTNSNGNRLVSEARTLTIAGTANQVISSAGAQTLGGNRT